MSKEVSKQVALQGPSITGTVTVSLIELDNLRANHAAAVKYASELEAKQGQVRVTVVERGSIGTYELDRYGRQRYVNDERYSEIAVHYKGLDEFREIIRQEENEKVINDMRTLQATIKDKNNSLLAANQQILDLESEIKKIKKTEVGALTTENKDLQQKVKMLESYKEKYEKQVSITDGINTRLAEVSRELEKEKRKKGFWSFLG